MVSVGWIIFGIRYKANSRDTHDFHTHENVDFSHIYYVQLKDMKENNVIVGCSDIEE